MEWLSNNREWVFSGIAGVVLSIVFDLVRRKQAKSTSRQNVHQVTGPVLQGGRDVNVTFGSGAPDANDSVGHDRRLFQSAQAIVDHAFLNHVLGQIANDHSHYMSETMQLDTFYRFLISPDTRFISSTVREEAAGLAGSLKELLSFLALYFFVYPQNQVRDDTRFCMQPNLNMDRDGDGSEQQSKKYDLLTTQLIERVDAVERTYESFRDRVRTDLMV